ncbi:WD40/YVTN/BNR-like repeat-containing protein [Peredibacter sp. HCB2-198]|uniref:WD40/YVTN/BNR-like repeat-containing protein n=1 Tax=Peredibacter sp. HCB2-198 TaxID=3383025 RepID=UPI0038B6176A
MNGKLTEAPTNQPTLIWNYDQPVLRAGESIPFAFSNGVSGYTTDPNGIGTFDPNTLIYSVPLNQAPLTHYIYATDGAGMNGSNNVKIAGFQVGERIDFPIAFGDQNFVTSSATLANGDIFISSIVSDSPGWERWVINKTSDVGLTWTQVDHYAPHEEGESHPLAMIAKNNDLYVCGYQWEYGSSLYNSEWIIRKTTNGGTSWSTVDQYGNVPGEDNVCYDIDLHGPSGILYAVGYDGLGGVIKESVNDGATWTIIGSLPAVDYFSSVKISPAGVVWAVSDLGELWKGTFSLGTWNWVNEGTIMGGTIQNSAYQLRGDLEIVSETEAYFSGDNGSWRIAKTTDGGANWVNVYNGPANSSGQDIKSLSSGEIVSTGYFNTTPHSYVILQSPDDGTTWNVQYQSNTPAKEGVTMIPANDGSIMAFGVFDNSPYQIINMRSTDNGLSWSERGLVFFKQHLWTQLKDFKRDANGNLWAVGYVGFIDNTFSDPWVVIKSGDNGINWTQSDVYTDAGNMLTAGAIAFGPANEIYVGGVSSDDGFYLRKSSDDGVTWNTVDVNPGYLYEAHVTVAPDGTAYYMGKNGATCDLRKGTANGTVWSTVQTFPIEPGSIGCDTRALEAFSDGSLWLSVRELGTGPVNQGVIYRSTDGGVTFTEVFRESQILHYQTLKRLANGDVLAQSYYTVMKTSDNGATWEVLYDGTSTLNEVKGFVLDNVGRPYVLDDNNRVWAQNQFDQTWFVTYDYTLINMLYGRELIKITDCGNSSGVCVLAKYEQRIHGAVNEMIPLVVP